MIPILTAILLACSTDQESSRHAPSPLSKDSKNVLNPPTADYQPSADVISTAVAPTVFLSQTWFHKSTKKPGPARIEMWRKESSHWTRFRLEDADSNTFHKLELLENERSFLTIGATAAHLKKWHFDGVSWSSQTLYSKSWKDQGGRFDRFRDLEIGDVDGDQKDEYIMATHDYGEIIVLHPDESYRAESFGTKENTFVHEIELADLNGDGLLEIYATPSDRNSSTRSQSGNIVQYAWNGSTFVMKMVDQITETHAKEILTVDIDNDGKAELFGVIEAQKKDGEVLTPVEIRRYEYNLESGFSFTKVGSIPDDQTRFLVSGDFNYDGKTDLVAASHNKGIFLFTQSEKGGWSSTLVDAESGGFEHACYGADLDSDGKMELYVASDKHGRLSRYRYDSSSTSFNKDVIGSYSDKMLFTWNVVVGQF